MEPTNGWSISSGESAESAGSSASVAPASTTSAGVPQLPMYIEQIREILPHRYPFLLVDRVTGLDPGKSAHGYKLITANEPQFTGHFPEFMIMPGVMMIEAIAQLGGIAVLGLPEYANKRPMLAGVDGFRFRRPVRPGDKLEMAIVIDRLRGQMGKGTGRATVDGQLVCEGTILFAIDNPS